MNEQLAELDRGGAPERYLKQAPLQRLRRAEFQNLRKAIQLRPARCLLVGPAAAAARDWAAGTPAGGEPDRGYRARHAAAISTGGR
jgi:hypothetical protein